MIAQTQDYIDCHGIPTSVPLHRNPEGGLEDSEEDEEEEYQPDPALWTMLPLGST